MAFVSNEKRLVFIHIPKNAGTSICKHLSMAHGLDLTGKRDFKHNGVGNNIPPQFRPNGINVHDTLEEVHAKYPVCQSYVSFAVVRNPWARLYSFYLHKLRLGDKDLPPHGSFAEVFQKSNVLLLQPQFYWCRGADRVLRYEHLDDDYQRLSLDFDLKGDLPHLNRSQSDESYRDHYDDYSRKLIGEFYRYEIEQLGYQF
ncbi:sulfotransferase family 2 domain-containing protein [Methylophaga sp. OBS4]|uniref:sulfotransferase family 2 domain-containing protein n=1 Tax=Methylophaga sp. OBS4 TaxID=2991935 RepID=UPI00224F1D0E|nr:sulfotransferase family 2 domain-containing protein [Methylophaga sp. OBS4]MCX4186767.1 sulfotransferase family protein [Methylophaga sp. OBS4]